MLDHLRPTLCEYHKCVSGLHPCTAAAAAAYIVELGFLLWVYVVVYQHCCQLLCWLLLCTLAASCFTSFAHFCICFLLSSFHDHTLVCHVVKGRGFSFLLTTFHTHMHRLLNKRAMLLSILTYPQISHFLLSRGWIIQLSVVWLSIFFVGCWITHHFLLLIKTL